MDLPDLLPTIAILGNRALQAERAHAKRNQDLSTLRGILKRTTADLEDATKLADVLYETCQRMGTVIDYLIKESKAQSKGDGESGSFEAILNSVLEQLEAQEVRDGAQKAEQPEGTRTGP
ncbi:hypothetical protein BDV40DRAFT_306868 [Aspergillus tamarii]|uniref:Uncharacterized protein n=1 Tax=Aspergillus tamarii TaxID=41984 RepID=A0A5N6UAG6_ASPTM|nr:hypothetical protein BDV40DRAFT_306868 [Aspergillus tamarii]